MNQQQRKPSDEELKKQVREELGCLGAGVGIFVGIPIALAILAGVIAVLSGALR